jgi:D-lactate dehydrogenase
MKSDFIMYDVFFYEAFEEEVQALKSGIQNKINVGYSWKTIQEAAEELPPATLISIRTQSQVPASWAGSLKGILTRSTGYEHLLKYKNEVESSTLFGYLPLYCNRAVAEQACMLWLSLLRKLNLQIKQFKDFNRDGLTGLECENKTLLVVGVGNIGSEVVKIGEGMGMEVLGVDIVRRFEQVKYVSIKDAISKADIIVCAMNLTKENVAYFNYDRLKKAKKGAIFINIARGEMSPSGDLLKLIEEQHLGGVGMDVFDQEAELATLLREGKRSFPADIQATMTLANKNNVIFTPHNAFNTRESVQRKSQQSIQQIENFLNKGQFIWPIPESE